MPPTLTNAEDVARKWPSTAHADRFLLENEGIRVAKITGPAAGATVVLPYPAIAILDIQAFVTASGAWPASPLKPNLTEGVDYDVELRNANGVCALTEKVGTSDYSTTTWRVMYQKETQEGTIGGQSSI